MFSMNFAAEKLTRIIPATKTVTKASPATNPTYLFTKKKYNSKSKPVSNMP